MPHIIKSCDNCQESYICFMVKQSIWKTVFERYDCARVCLSCFEQRLGRKLTAADLMTREEIFEVATRCNDFYREALTLIEMEEVT
jgi:hypothetical protein